ncbi:MAG: hypothetical protein COB61_011535 [Thiotrichales bacterium]|nr:hypothetical protein [Thiotrichales bacterium]
MKNLPKELLEIAENEKMNPMDLFNNIVGTLRTVNVRETAVIYDISQDCITIIKQWIDNEQFLKNKEALNTELYDEDFISAYYELEEEFYVIAKKHNITEMRLADWLREQ